MRPIQKLSKDVVDRIAAGEVVQRPSAALKELLENSIDAGSTRVSVTSQDGGLSVLQITDDGFGIDEKDLPLLCERFATSKLSHFDDLMAMSTFGFRGEALASISHVAKITVTTKTKESRYAVKVKYADGKMLSNPAPTAGNGGTTMLIEDLFHNMMVRRKALLPKASEEYTRIIDVMVKYAFAFPHIGFSLRKLGNSSSTSSSSAAGSASSSSAGAGGLSAAALASAKTEFNFPEKSTTIANLRQYYGHSITKALHPIFYPNTNNTSSSSSSNGNTISTNSNLLTEKSASPTAGAKNSCENSFPISFSGYASDITLNHRRPIFILFINKRLVESAALKRTIDQAYAPYLVNDNKPFVFLDVTVAPNRLDVNVHPTKHEVLLLDEERVCSALHETLTIFIRGLGDRLVAGSVAQRGNKGMDGDGGSSSSGGGNMGKAMIGSSIVGGGKAPIDPQILNLKPVAGMMVQVAPSTISRTVSQRGDLLRLFKSAKEREEQARLTASSPFEQSSYYDRSPSSAVAIASSVSSAYQQQDAQQVRGINSAPQQQQGERDGSRRQLFVTPSAPNAPATDLRIDEVLDLTNLCDDDDDDNEENDDNYLKKHGDTKQKAIANNKGHEEKEGGINNNNNTNNNPLLSLIVNDREDDDSNSNIALAFPALTTTGSDDEEEDAAEKSLYGGGVGGGGGIGKGKGKGGEEYDDSDGTMRLESAMADFKAYMLAQQQDQHTKQADSSGSHAIAPHLFHKVSSPPPAAQPPLIPNTSYSSSPRAGTAEEQRFPSLVTTASLQATTAAPPPPTFNVRLEFVENKIAHLNSPSCTSPEAKHLFRSLTYVGILNHQHILAQSGTSLLMIDWRPVVEEISYQRLVMRWGRHRLSAFAHHPRGVLLDEKKRGSSCNDNRSNNNDWVRREAVASCPRVSDLLRHCLEIKKKEREVKLEKHRARRRAREERDEAAQRGGGRGGLQRVTKKGRKEPPKTDDTTSKLAVAGKKGATTAKKTAGKKGKEVGKGEENDALDEEETNEDAEKESSDVEEESPEEQEQRLFPPLPSLISLLSILSDWREMLAEYFGIIIEYPPSPPPPPPQHLPTTMVPAAAGAASPSTAAVPPSSSSSRHMLSPSPQTSTLSPLSSACPPLPPPPPPLLGSSGACAQLTNTSLLDLRITAVPVLIGDRWPVNQAEVPWMLYRLASDVDYSSTEEMCFEGVLRAVSETIGGGFFFQCLSTKQSLSNELIQQVGEGDDVKEADAESKEEKKMRNKSRAEVEVEVEEIMDNDDGEEGKNSERERVGSKRSREESPPAVVASGEASREERTEKEETKGEKVKEITFIDGHDDGTASQPNGKLGGRHSSVCALSSSRGPPQPPPRFINSVENPQMIMTFPQCHDLFVHAVQGALLPSLSSTSLFQPPTRFLTDGTIKSVVTVEALYKVFERC